MLRIPSNINSDESRYTIIDNIVKQLLEKDENLDEKFNGNIEICKRLNDIKDLLDKYELLPSEDLMRIQKGSDESMKYHIDGIQQFKNGEYRNALISYNKSIAFAETDCPLLTRGYAKRASVFFQLKLYKPCLRDINLALGSDRISGSLKKQIRELRDICNNEIKKSVIKTKKLQSDMKDFLVIHAPPNSNVPFITNCLEFIDSSNHYGYGIKTKNALQPGDIISNEIAYVSTLCNSVRYQRCGNCLRENMSLIPCPKCTTELYCNQKCLQIAYKKFHKYECEKSDYLIKLFPDDLFINFRAPLQTIVLFKDIQQLMAFDTSNNTPKNVFQVNHNNIKYDDVVDDTEIPDDNTYYNSKMTSANYVPIHGLLKVLAEPKFWNTSVYLFMAVETFLIYKLFCEIFVGQIATKVEEEFIQKFIYRHILGSRMYYHRLHLYKEHISSDTLVTFTAENYGTGAFPFAAFINHSCAQNVARIHNGTTLKYVVVKPILAGEQLFDNYCNPYTMHCRTVRQEYLKSRFNFLCKCVACEEDYPLMDELSKVDLRLDLLDKFGPLDSPKTYNSNDLMKLIKLLIDYLNTYYDGFYPCRDIVLAENRFVGYLDDLVRRSVNY